MPAFSLLALLIAAAPAAAPIAAAGTPAPAPVLEPGRYVLVIEVVGQRSVPLLGDLEMRTRTTTLVDLVKDGTELVATEQACTIASAGTAPWGGPLFDGGADPTTVAALGRPSWRIPAIDRVRIDLGPRPLGYTGGAVPTKSDDPRVTDPDKNGRPGALMHMDVNGIGRLSIDVVGFWATALDGAVLSADLARGRVKVRTEERILAGLPIPAQLGPMRVDEKQSTFTLTRLPTMQAGCAVARASR